MASINYTNYNIDQTVRIFDQFYDYSSNVPAAEYDIVLTFFKSVFTTQYAAENFTSSLFRIAEQTNTDALTLLASFENQSICHLDVANG